VSSCVLIEFISIGKFFLDNPQNHFFKPLPIE